MVQAEEYKMLCVGGKLSPTSDNKQFRDDKNLQDYEVIYGLSDDDLKFVAEVNQVTTGLPDLEPEIYCISDDEFDMEDKDSTVTSSGDLEPELDDDTAENHKTDDDEGHKAVADVQLLEPEVYDDTAEDHKVKGREHKARADDQKQKTKVYDATRSKCKKESRKRNIKKETEKLNKRKREVEAQLTNLMESTRIAKKSIQQKIDVGSRSIYVGNVDPEATSEELKQHFHGCGFISRVEILCNSRDGNPNRIANIEFKDKDSVRISLAMDNSLFRGRQITVIPKRANLIDIKAKRSSKEFSRDTRETDRQTDEEFTREATRGGSRCRESIRENTRGCYDDYTSVHRSRYRKGYSVTY